MLAVFLIALAWQASSTEAVNVNNASLHILANAVKTHGAMCLDGSPMGYFLREGSGEGATKWILHLGGGGWCNTTKDSYNRSLGLLGSSKHWPHSAEINGFLSDDFGVNPDFYNWNIVYVMYCDGASFAGYVEKPDMYNNTALYYRGRANLKASLDDLLSNGMDMATDIILTGCSAGGLAVLLHADTVRSYLPNTVKKYKAFVDAGYFPDTRNFYGELAYRSGIQRVFEMQNVIEGLNQDCVKDNTRANLWKCMFAPLNDIYYLPCLPPQCNETNMKDFYKYGQTLLTQAKPVFDSPPINGYFIDSCLIHCHTLYDHPWIVFSIDGTSVRESFAHWYNEDTPPGEGTRLRDCEVPYNCDQSCFYKNSEELFIKIH